MAVSIVALRAAGLGDLLTAVPALRVLQDYSPPGWAQRPTEVVVAAPRWLHPLVDLIPGVTRAADVAGLRPLVRERPMLAVNLHGRGPQSHEALMAVRPRELLAFQARGVWRTGPAWMEEEPERVRWCRLLRWVGLRADPNRLDIAVPDILPAMPGAVVLHLGATGSARSWPAERFAEVAAHLVAVDEHEVVLTGTSHDLVAARLVAEHARLRRGRTLVDRLSLPQLVAQVASSRLVVSADTGVAHLASALGVPSIVVFGPESPRRWGPPPLDRHRVLRAPGTAPTADQVPARAVIHQAEDLLQSVSV